MPNMQMNFRIDAELKRRGDERFARFGCTPSEAMAAALRGGGAL